MKFVLMCLSLAVTAAVAVADPVQILSPGDLGLAQSLVVNGTPSGSSQMGVGGGEFSGTVNGDGTLFWCVDSQEVFTPGDSGFGNVTLLGNVDSQSNSVKFGNVTDAGNPHWTNTTDAFDGVALPSDAGSRFAMAAYLITQYNGFVATEAGAVVTNSNQDLAIQDAIWALTNNSSLTGGFSTISGNDSNKNSDQYWIHQALLNYAGVNTADWAVVSWSTDSAGNLNPRADKQTFLVLVDPTPEPRLLGLLAAGLAGLCFLGRRKMFSAK